MSDPTGTNSTATFVSKTVGTVLSDVLDTAETAMIADVPALGLPVVKQVWEFLLGWIFSYVNKAAQLEAAWTVIDVQVAQETNNVTTATAALEAAQATGDQNAINTARAAEDAAAAALLHSDGSAPN